MEDSLYTIDEKECYTRILNSINKYVGRKKGFEKKLKDGLQHIYWGITIDYNIDIKILFVLNKLIDMAKLGNKITILVADIHSLLEKQREIPIYEIEKFIKTIDVLIASYNLEPNVREKIKIIRGSEFQLSPKYILDFYKLISINGTIKDYADHFNLDLNEIEFKDVVNPILQTLDEAHIMKISELEVDCQVGYTKYLNQYVFSKKHISKLGFKTKTYLLYDIPDYILTKKIYINEGGNYLVPKLNSCPFEVIDFILNTFFDYAFLSNFITKEQRETEHEKYNDLSNEEKIDTVYKLMSDFYLNHVRPKLTPS